MENGFQETSLIPAVHGSPSRNPKRVKKEAITSENVKSVNTEY
jgi:hypothetical protein